MQNRFHYTIKQKLEILDAMEEEKSSNLHPVKKSQLDSWRAKQEEYSGLTQKKQQKTCTLHQGPSMKYAELYSFLYSQVKDLRDERRAINHNLLIGIAIEEVPEIANLTPSGQRSLIDRFMKFFNLSIRTITSTSGMNNHQISTEDAEIIVSFKANYLRVIQENSILEEDVFNMDQSGLNYETPPKTTIEIIGSQQVPIASAGGEKKRITIISLINCSGHKFRQLGIFKGTSGARVEREVKLYNDHNNCFFAQENAWTDKAQIDNWLNSVWYPIAISRNRPKLLLIDALPLHKDFEKKFELYNTQVMYIHKGLTWTLQPLDSLYHKTYKKYARDYFIAHQKSTITSEEDRRKQVIETAKEIHLKITEEVVKASWKQVGLEFPRNQNELIMEGSLRIPEDDSMLIEDENDNLFA